MNLQGETTRKRTLAQNKQDGHRKEELTNKHLQEKTGLARFHNYLSSLKCNMKNIEHSRKGEQRGLYVLRGVK